MDWNREGGVGGLVPAVPCCARGGEEGGSRPCATECARHRESTVGSCPTECHRMKQVLSFARTLRSAELSLFRRTLSLKVFVGAKKGKYNASEDFRRISHIGDTFTSVFSERRPSGLFLPACSQAFAKHSMVTDDSFCDVYKIDGVTLCQAIAQWHKSKGQQQVALQDKCRHPCDGGKPGVCTQRAFN